MAQLSITLSDELKQQAEQSNLDLARLFTELIRRELLKQKMVERFNSEEEQELIKWSVDLGRRTKKGRFKKLLKKVSPEIKEKLLSKRSPKKREELLSR